MLAKDVESFWCIELLSVYWPLWSQMAIFVAEGLNKLQ